MTDEIDRLRAELWRAQNALAEAQGRPHLTESRRRARRKHLSLVGEPELPALPTSLEAARTDLANAQDRHKGCTCSGLDRYDCKGWQSVQWYLSGYELELAK